MFSDSPFEGGKGDVKNKRYKIKSKKKFVKLLII